MRTDPQFHRLPLLDDASYPAPNMSVGAKFAFLACIAACFLVLALLVRGKQILQARREERRSAAQEAVGDDPGEEHCKGEDIELPTVPVSEQFLAVADQAPGRVALVYPSGTGARCEMTYGELAERVRYVARQLAALGVKKGDIVALNMFRGAHMVVATYAVFLAGAAWVPVDPEVPAERKLELVKDSRAKVVVTQAGLGESVAELTCAKAEIVVDGSTLLVSGSAVTAAGAEVLPLVSLADAAIILYTSGTTGKPKGIIYSHQHVSHGSNTLADLCDLGPGSIAFLKTPFIWAVVEWELFPALVRGAKLVVATAMGHKDPVYLSDTVAKEKVTVLVMAPKVLDLLFDVHSSGGQLATLKNVVAVGEGFPIAMAKRCVGLRNFQAKVHNVYGASESSATVWTVPRDLDTRVWTGKMAPVGRPQPGCSVWILDKQRKQVPTGCTGEIVFGGQLADGYWNLPETTAEKFLELPEYGRVYMSGDLGRWKAGEVEIVGRADRQVKIRGVRVEPEEIEATIKSFTRSPQDAGGLLEAGAGAGFTGVGVVATAEPADLFAWVAPTLSPEEMEELKTHCKNNLPPYYVPKYFMSTDALPQLANGKVNLRALTDLANQHVSESTELVQDSLGQMRNMSKSAMLENQVLHRCYTVWLFGVLTDHWNSCGMDSFPYSCGTLTAPTVAGLPSWVELFVRQIGNDQDMFGFILFGALQDSRPEAGQTTKKIRLGYPDLFLFFVYLLAGFPIPQLLHAIMPGVINEECASAWPADGCSGHRWYLLMTVWVHVFLALFQLLRIWPSVQVLAHGLLAMFGPTFALDLCSTSTPSWFKWTNAWIWGLRSTTIGDAGDTCPIYWGWFQVYVFYYVAAYYYSRPCMELIKNALARVNGQYWAIGAGAGSILLGSTMAAFHYPNISTEYGVHDPRFKWWDFPLEVGADAVQPILLALAMAWLPVDMSWWGNSTLGTYIFHFYIRTQMHSNWIPTILRHMEGIPGGVVQLLVVLALPFIFVTFIGPIGHYLLLTPGFIMAWAQRRFSRSKPSHH